MSDHVDVIDLVSDVEDNEASGFPQDRPLAIARGSEPVIAGQSGSGVAKKLDRAIPKSGQDAKSNGGSASFLRGWLGGSPQRPSALAAPVLTSSISPARAPVEASSAASASTLATGPSHRLVSSENSGTESSLRLASGSVVAPPRFPLNPSYRSVDSPQWSFHPVEHACWAANGAAEATGAPYLHLARAFAAVEPVTGRIRIAGMLVNTFRVLLAQCPGDVLPALLLMTNNLGSPHEGLALSIGGSTVAAAVSEATGVKRERLSAMYGELGDMGDVAEKCARNQRTLVPPPPLTIRGVLDALLRISRESGPGCAGRKQGLLLKLLRSCREIETRYIVRTMVQNLRIGVNITSALQCLARAVALNEAAGCTRSAPSDAWAHSGGGSRSGASASSSTKATGKGGGAGSKRGAPQPADCDAAFTSDIPAPVSAAMDAAGEAAKTCYSLCPDLDLLVSSLLSGGVAGMQRACTITPGTPVKPMLAKITAGVHEVLAKYRGRPLTAEWKYDGQRSQIHGFLPPPQEGGGGASSSSPSMLAGSTVRVFSRHMDDTTDRWPDVADAVRKAYRPIEPQLQGSASISSSSSTDAARQPSFIIDAELVAVEVSASPDGKDQSGAGASALGASLTSAPSVRILPFQTLSTRKRTDVTAEGVSVRVCIYAFDLLLLDGTPLTHLPLAYRRALLRQRFTLTPGVFDFATGIDILAPTEVPAEGGNDDADAGVEDVDPTGVPALDTASASTASSSTSGASSSAVVSGSYATVHAALSSFLMAAIDACCEGIMCKLLATSEEQWRRAEAVATAAGTAPTAPPDDDDAIMLLSDSDDDAAGEEVEAAPPAKRRKMPVASSSSASAKPGPGTGKGTAAARKRGAASSSSSDYSLVATYQPSVRSNAWLKVKRDYVEGLADTLDLVPLGAWRGNGRKAGWFSPFLLGAYNPEAEEWQSVCRVMSGFTDEFYKRWTAYYSEEGRQLDPQAASRIYSTREVPDVWFKPLAVWEIKGADLTLSPVHAAGAGLVHPDRGISLRFPRFMRDRTPEKGCEDASTGGDVAELYRRQSRKMVHGSAAAGAKPTGAPDEDDEDGK